MRHLPRARARRLREPGVRAVVRAAAALGLLELAAGVAGGGEPPHVGHTRGSCARVVAGECLVPGDHLWAWGGGLEMGRSVSRSLWTPQKASLRSLQDFRFKGVLGGHGRSLPLPAPRMRAAREEVDAR